MTGWTIQTLVATTLLMAIVLMVRMPAARAFGPHAAYALWALPALRLVLPALPGWHMLYVPVLWLHDPHTTVGLVDPLTAARHAAELPVAPLSPLPVAPEVLPWTMLLLGAWLGGAALWFGWQMIRYRLFLARALRGATLLTRECGVDVLLTPHVDGPVAAGFMHRRIFLPLDFITRYTPAERRLALLHEGAHHDRHDIVANLAALGVLALHWFNPLAHRAYRAFRADQELACDATVLAGIASGERHAYGSAVLKSASARMPGVACALSHKDELKRRLRTMARPAIGTPRLWAGGAVTLAAIAAGLLVTAAGEASTLSPGEIAAIRADAEQARVDGLRAADDGRRAAAGARRDGERTRGEALRAAMQARAEGARAAAVGRDAQDEGGRQIAAVRRQMAARCAATGRPVSTDLDWGRLALCGDSGAAIAARARAQAEARITRSVAAVDMRDGD